MNIFGFSLLRNGLKYDYPFLESLSSLSTLCSLVYLALGDSEDQTEASLKKISNLEIIRTQWDENFRKSGLILSQQTNISLSVLREKQTTGWAFYLQADEVINDNEFDLIKSDLEKAWADGCDAVSFRYLHFWQRYDQIAIAKRWYPQEIRAIKIESEIVSYGDAQSFSGAKKIYYSDAHIYHYGHVREESAYKKKLTDFGRWWHSDQELKKVLARGMKKDRKEESIPFFGTHPTFMQKRIGNIRATKEKILAYGNKNNFPWLNHPGITWTSSPLEVIRAGTENAVLLEDFPYFLRPLQKISFPSRVPKQMKSPQSRPWKKEFWTMLKFSEKGFVL